MSGDDAIKLWRKAFYFHRCFRSQYPLEYSEDFASYVVYLELKGNVPKRLEDAAKAFYWVMRGEDLVDEPDRFNPPAPDTEETGPDFTSLPTASERRALLRELDRHIVRPRASLWERLSQGYEPIDAVPSAKARELALRERADELLEELRMFEQGKPRTR